MYESWRPFRNVLRNTDLLDSLGVVRAYSVYRQFGKNYPMPQDIGVHSSFYQKWTILLPWELETLTREILIICSPEYAPSKSLKKWKDLASAVNKLKRIEDDIAKQFIDQDNIYNEVMIRLAHRQFRYQTDGPSNETIVRYYKLYSNPEVAKLVEQKLGLSPLKIIRIGAGLWANYLKFLGLHYPLKRLELSGITQDDYDKFMGLFSQDMDSLQKMMRSSEHRKLDDTFLYAFHELQQYPIIFTEMNDKPTHICPQPTLLFWRITTGLYYDLINVKGFGQHFGNSFEQYIGDVSEVTLEKSSTLKVYGEEDNTGPNRCDWIIDDADAFLIVECKTKRLTLAAKTSLNASEAMDEQLELLAKAAVQSYKTLEAYKNGKYKQPLYAFSPHKQPYIAVVTMEKWYLMGITLRELEKKIISLLNSDGLKGKVLVESTPLIVLSMTEYEDFIYIVQKYGMKKVVEPSREGKKFNGWQFSVYLEDEFKEDLKSYSYVFADKLDGIFKPEGIKGGDSNA